MLSMMRPCCSPAALLLTCCVRDFVGVRTFDCHITTEKKITCRELHRRVSIPGELQESDHDDLSGCEAVREECPRACSHRRRSEPIRQRFDIKRVSGVTETTVLLRQSCHTRRGIVARKKEHDGDDVDLQLVETERREV